MPMFLALTTSCSGRLAENSPSPVGVTVDLHCREDIRDCAGREDMLYPDRLEEGVKLSQLTRADICCADYQDRSLGAWSPRLHFFEVNVRFHQCAKIAEGFALPCCSGG
jgi:hypothetical protein